MVPSLRSGGHPSGFGKNPYLQVMASSNWHLFESNDTYLLLREGGNVLVTGKAKRKKLCIARYGEQFYAFGARCPHAGGPLGAGSLNEKGQVVCPWHRFGFDLQTGDCESGGYFIPTYQVEKRGVEFWINFPKKRFSWW